MRNLLDTQDCCLQVEVRLLPRLFLLFERILKNFTLLTLKLEGLFVVGGLFVFCRA
jgi:hypothetical protein